MGLGGGFMEWILSLSPVTGKVVLQQALALQALASSLRPHPQKVWPGPDRNFADLCCGDIWLQQGLLSPGFAEEGLSASLGLQLS